MMDDNYYMNFAIAAARVGVSKDNSPFGATIIGPNGNIVACGHNKVLKTGDPCAHAEIVTIRKAIQAPSMCKNVLNDQGEMVGWIMPCASNFLKDCTIYSTTEPCLGCFGFIHWSRIKKIVYGVSLDIAAQYGFNELKIYNKQIKEISGSKIEIISGVLEKECIQLFEDWKEYNGETY